MRGDEVGKMVIILWDSPPMTVGNTNVCNKRLGVEINAKNKSRKLCFNFRDFSSILCDFVPVFVGVGVY